MENAKSNTGQNLGVAAIITAIVSFVLAIIPCIGLLAIIPGIIAIVLGAVGLSLALGNRSAKGVSIAGLIIAIIACSISVSQVFIAGRLLNEQGIKKLPTELQNIIMEVKSGILQELENENFSIKIEKDGEKIKIDGNSIDIKINESIRDLEKKLEELEGVKSSHDSLQKK
jgi:hypothetical protein